MAGKARDFDSRLAQYARWKRFFNKLITAGLLIKAPHTRRTLLFLGTLLLVAGLVYGGLTALLLGGID